MSCNFFKSGSTIRSDDSDSSTNSFNNGLEDLDNVDDTYKSGSVNLQLNEINIGVRNYEQILATMSEKIGLPVEGSVLNAFERASNNLATDTDVYKFSAAHQASIYKLAGEFCRVALDNDEVKKKLFGTIPDSYDELLQEGVRMSLAARVLKNLWPESMTADDGSAEPQGILAGLITQIDISYKEENPNANNNNRRRAVLTGVCTAALSSAPVTLYE